MVGESDAVYVESPRLAPLFNISSGSLEHTYVPQKTRALPTHLKVPSTDWIPRELFMAITFRPCVRE